MRPLAIKSAEWKAMLVDKATGNIHEISFLHESNSQATYLKLLHGLMSIDSV
jgi:hypothetical protein